MKKSKKMVGLVVAACLALLIALWYYLPSIMITAKQEILKQAQGKINGALYINQVRLSGFFEVTADGVQLADNTGKMVFQSNSVAVRFNIFTFLFDQKQPLKAVSTISIAKDSKIYLTMNEEEKWNIDELLTTNDDSKTPFYALVKVNQAQVLLQMPQGKWELGVSGTVDAAQNPLFALNLSIKEKENKIKVAGSFGLDGYGRLTISTNSLAVESLATLVKQAVAVDGFSGILKDVNIMWENSDKGNTFNGKISFAAVSGNYRLDENSFHIVLDGGISIKNNKLTFSALKTSINEQIIDVTGGLSLQNQLPYADKLVLVGKDFLVNKVLTSSIFEGAMDYKMTFDGPLNQRFEGLLASGEMTFGQSSFSGVHLDGGKLIFNYKENTLLLEKGNIDIWGGKADIYGHYDLKNEHLIGNINMQSIDLSKYPQKGDWTGIIDVVAHFSGGTSYEKLNFAANVSSQAVYFRSLALRDINASIDKEGKTVELKSASGNIGNGSFNAHGIVEGAPISLIVQAADLPLADLFATFGRQAAGLLHGHVNLQGSWTNISGNADLYALDGVIEKQPFKTVKSHFFINDNVLNVQSLLLEMNYGVHYVVGNVDMKQAEPVMDLSLISKAVRLEPLAALALPGEKITGNLDSFVALTGTISNPQVKGEVLIYEASFRDYFVEKINGRYTYTADRATLDKMNVKFMQTSVFLNGTVNADGRLELNFEGDNVRLENLPRFEGVTTSGGVALKGALTGTFAKPFFNGSINSEEVLVNGQAINNVAGAVWSEGGLNNYVRATFSQGKGKYSLDAGVNFDERFAHGLLEVKNGNVNSLLAVAGQNTQINGLINGTIVLNSGGKRNGMTLDATISDASVRDVPFEKIDINLHWQRGKFTIGRFEAQQGIGTVLGRGIADLNGDIDIECSGNGLNASLLTSFMDKPVDFGGNLSFSARAGGQMKNPDISASVQISSGNVENVFFDNLSGLFSVKNDAFNIEQLFIAKGEHKVSAYGVVPVDLLRQSANRKNPHSQMDIQVKLNDADLSLIPSIFANDVEWGFGRTEGELNIKGTLEKPEYYGGVQIKDGTLKFSYLRNPLDKINVDAIFDGNRVFLKQFEGVMGKGDIKAEGSLSLNSLTNDAYDFKIQVNKFELASEIVTGPLTCNFEITPQVYRNTIRPMIKGDILLEHITIDLPVVPEFGEGSYNLGLDVTVKMGDKVRLYNKYLYDMLLEGNLHIIGSTMFANVEGMASVKRGTIKYLNTPFKIDSAVAAFPIPGSPMPNINLRAHSRINSTNIYVAVHGPLDEMDVTLTSDPPMSQQEIFRLITLKTRAAESSTMTDEDMRNLLAAGLQMTIFGNVEDFLNTTFGIDEFRIFQGSIDTGVGFVVDSRLSHHNSKEDRDQYNLYIGKYLTDKILLSYTMSFDNKDRRFAIQYELDKRVSLGASIDEDSKMYYGIEYRISF